MKALRFLQKRYKILAVVFLMVGILLASGMVYKAYATDYGAVEQEVGSFAQSIINILTGKIAIGLCVASFIAAAASLMFGRTGAAIGCAIAGVILGAAYPIAKAIMGKH